MARDSGRSSRLPRSGDDEEGEVAEDPKGLMAEIDSGASKGYDAPVATSSAAPEEPPDNPPAYTPPITERWGKLMSRVNYPLDVPHQEGAIRLSPRAILTVDGNKLGDVPTGARFVPDRR